MAEATPPTSARMGLCAHAPDNTSIADTTTGMPG